MFRRRTWRSLACAAALILALPAAGRASVLEMGAPPVPRTADGPFLPTAVEPNFGEGLGAGRGHEGFDLFAPAGSRLLAVSGSEVLDAGAGSGGEGNFVSLYDPRTERTYNYFHLLGLPPVRPGQRVEAGQVVGRLGCSGSCYGNHLHFEIRVGRGTWGEVIDPEPFLRGADVAPKPNVAAVRRLG